VQATSVQALAERFGQAAADEMAAFVSKQIYAMKRVVEEEGLECEFELRRSHDVWCNADEAKAAKAYVKASHKTEQRWAVDVDLVEDRLAEQVCDWHSNLCTSFLTCITGHVHQRC
jgi:hypothetical protein